MADLSIVVATHRSPEQLARCLAHVSAQTALDQVAAVIVVQDGADPAADRVLDRSGLGDRLVRLAHERARGPAAARNLGIAQVRTAATLLLDDDVLLAPDAVAALLRAGLPTDVARPSLRGHVTWHPEEPVTPFMYWQEHGGAQLPFDELPASGEGGWRFYGTSLIVTATTLLQRHRFDERFRAARYEDMELGHRLERATAHRIRLVRDAIGWRLHRTSLVDWLGRMPTFADAACRFATVAAADPSVADAIGVTAAQQVDRFVWRDLELAATLTGALEPTVPIPPRATNVYGQLWEWECLATAYRMLRHFFFLSTVRATLGLPVAMAVDAAITANEAQVLLLERFARRARQTRPAARRREEEHA